MTTDAALEAFLAHPVGAPPAPGKLFSDAMWIGQRDAFKTAFDLQQAKIDELGKKNYDLINELAERQKRVDELAKDAERYRHMRGNSKFRDMNGPGLYWYLPRLLCGSKAEQLDAAIDSAIQQSTHTGG